MVALIAPALHFLVYHGDIGLLHFFFVLFENLNVSSQTWLTALQEFMSDYGKKHDIQYFPITTCRLLGNNSFVLFKSQQRMSY